jgi:hypothetical protein
MNLMRYFRFLLFGTMAFLVATPAQCAPHTRVKRETIEDLKKLEIICLVPGWLPDGYHVKSVEIDYSDRDGVDDPKASVYPGYAIEYSNGKKGLFTIESARTGIGDRNLDEDERAEESKFDTDRLGTFYTIYFPPGKGGVKKRIVANWIEDANLHAQKAKDPTETKGKGRYHGVSGFGMTIADFEKIVRSLHPVRADKTPVSTSPQ